MSNSMVADESMAPNDERVASNGTARLAFQGDGNLVLYVRRPVGWLARWASNTAGSTAAVCVMQADGNLVLYDDAGAPVWASNTWGNNASSLHVQDDENVVIYAPDGTPVWSTDTWVGNWVRS